MKGPHVRLAGSGAAALLAGVLAAACGLDLRGLGSDVPDGAVDAAAVDATVDAEGDGPADGDALVDQSSDVREASAVDSSKDAPAEAADADSGASEAGDASPDACEAGGAEICNDGIDDNCDGLVDCADPQCSQQGYACAPAAPSGWQLVAYDPTARPVCATGWGSAAPLVEGPDGGGACQCFCGAPLENACAQGTAKMSLGQNVCGCANVQNVPLVSDGGCNPIGATIGQPCGPWGDGVATTLGPTPVACAESPQLPATTYTAQGQTCAPAQAAGAGCASGGACLPTVAPSTLCLEATGLQTTCPPGFPHLHVVYDPSNVVDQRQCGACGCKSAPTSCSGSTVTLYADSACTKSLVSMPANGQCNGLSGDPSTAVSFVYGATPNTTACAASSTSTAVDGGLLLRAPATICCP